MGDLQTPSSPIRAKSDVQDYTHSILLWAKFRCFSLHTIATLGWNSTTISPCLTKF